MVLDNMARKYVWGAGLVYAVDNSGSVLVYHADGLGSVQAITDASGAVVQTYQTDEFGVPTQSQGSVSQPFQYTGEQRDAEAGFAYLRARYYDPATGRFNSRDPLPGHVMSPGTLNRYVYAVNNPASLVDPSGLDGVFPGDSLDCTDPRNAVFCFLWSVLPGGNGLLVQPGGLKNFDQGYDDAVGGGGARAARGARRPATVEELIQMMNKRADVRARFASGEEEAYLEYMKAEGSHMFLACGKSDILLNKGRATRRTAFHEWMHHVLQKKNGANLPGEDKLIEDFLSRHQNLLKLSE